MPLRPEQLDSALARGLAPVYLLAGDEPLLVAEAADAIRRAARTAGHDERLVFDVDAGFDWDAVLTTARERSLFSQRRLLEIRMPDSKPGREGGGVLSAYAAEPADETCLLICSGRLDPAQRRSAWVRAIDQVGVVVFFWPIETARLPAWIGQRMRQAGLRPEGDACSLLAERVEGNLLACAQEIDKISVLKGRGARVGADEIVDLVADNARYDVFALVEAALAAEPSRLPRILDGLREEAVPATLVLWAIQRELHALLSMSQTVEAGKTIDAVIAERRIWPRTRQVSLRATLQRLSKRDCQRLIALAARIDRVIKGREPGNPWTELLQLTLLLAGTDVLGQQHHV